MYGYDAYGYDPATEGLGEKLSNLFETVKKKIEQFGKWIKNKMTELGLKIKRMTGTVSDEQVRKDSEDAGKLVDKIGEDIKEILKECCSEIDNLYVAWHDVGQYKFVDIKDASGDKAPDSRVSDRILEYKDGKSKNGYNDYTAAMKAKGGMGKLDKDAKNDSAKMDAWNKTKEELGIKFGKQAGKATEVSANLKKLSSFGPLTLKATQDGYKKLRDIFNANGKFGGQWKKIKIAAEWSTGDIRTALNKIVSMYDVGVRATTSFGNRLSSGNFRDDSGKKFEDKNYVKGVKSAAKIENQAYAHNKSRSDISTSRKDKAFLDRMAEESAGVDVLDRLYQMAYEDAMEDIEARAAALENFDAVPGYYEFADEAYESEPTYDPEYDLV